MARTARSWFRYPHLIVSDNGTEFTSNVMLGWGQERGVEWHFIAPVLVSYDAAIQKIRSGPAMRNKKWGKL